jgi:CrcB protein
LPSPSPSPREPAADADPSSEDEPEPLDPGQTGVRHTPTTGSANDPLAEDVIAGRPPGVPIWRGQVAITLGVSVGGVLGALARWLLTSLFPTPPGGFPVTTFAINAVGCLLMGALVVLVSEARQAHPIVRPFLGVGVLGGFTTFSTYTVEAHELLTAGHVGVAGLYLVATIVTALLAVIVGLILTRRATRLRRGRGHRSGVRS